MRARRLRTPMTAVVFLLVASVAAFAKPPLKKPIGT